VCVCVCVCVRVCVCACVCVYTYSILFTHVQVIAELFKDDDDDISGATGSVSRKGGAPSRKRSPTVAAIFSQSLSVLIQEMSK